MKLVDYLQTTQVYTSTGKVMKFDTSTGVYSVVYMLDVKVNV